MKKFNLLLLIITLSFSLVSCTSNTSSQNSSESSASAEKTLVTNKLSDFGLSDTTEYYGSIFAEKEISDIYIEINDADWQDILDNPTAEEYHSATLTINGETYENVGFRTKGFSSLTTVAQSDSDRYGFRVKMDKYVDNQTLNGLDDFVLNASFADASYMREYLTYSAMSYLNGITPFVNYTNLYINGELFGFYLSIEAYDDSFVERNTESNDVCLYKADSENCTLTANDDASGFALKYGNDENLDNVKSLIAILNETTTDNKEELEKILDINSVLKAIAVNTVLGNYDSYSGSKAHNYYLLYEDGKFSYVGWDYNMSLGGFNEDNGSSVTVDIASPFYNVDSSNRPLMEKLLEIDEYYDIYLSYLNDLVDYFNNAESMVNKIKDVISSNVENDPSAFYTFEQFTTATSITDTDLSQITSNMGGGPEGGNMQMPEGMTPPEGMELPTDGTVPNDNNIPTPGDMPTGENSLNPESMTPPEGMELPTGETVPEGMEAPSNGQAPPNDKNIGGGMISNESCSILDYITQRIENIKNQLN